MGVTMIFNSKTNFSACTDMAGFSRSIHIFWIYNCGYCYNLYQPVCLSVCLSVYLLSVYLLSVCLSVYLLSVCLSVCLSSVCLCLRCLCVHKITTVTLTVQGAGTQSDYLQKTKELAIESKTLDVSVDVSQIINVM